MKLCTTCGGGPTPLERCRTCGGSGVVPDAPEALPVMPSRVWVSLVWAAGDSRLALRMADAPVPASEPEVVGELRALVDAGGWGGASRLWGVVWARQVAQAELVAHMASGSPLLEHPAACGVFDIAVPS